MISEHIRKLVTLLITMSLFFCNSCAKEPEIIFSEEIERIVLGKNIGASYCTLDGVIYAGDASSGEMYQSRDEGNNWETVYRLKSGEGAIRCVFVSRSGTIFISRDHSGELKKSNDQGKTFNTCLELSDHLSMIWRVAENKKGWIYAAEYSTKSFEEKCAYIYRSKNDGNDWETIYHDPNSRHFHFIAVDPYTNYIYAATGDGKDKARLIRSVDGGDSWITLGNHSLKPEIDWQFTSIVFTPKYRIFGEDEPKQSDIVRTADDIHFEKVLVPDGSERYNFWAWGRIDSRGNILFGSWTQHAALSKYVRNIPSKANGVIYLSRDEGTTWIKVMDFGARKNHSGTHFASNIMNGSWIYCHGSETPYGFKIRVK